MKEPRDPGWNEENTLATSLGFKCVKDKARGWGWCRFEKGDWTVWSIGGWSVAKLVDNHWTNHKKYDDLEAALKSVPD